MRDEMKLVLKSVKPYWARYILGIAALFMVDYVNTLVPRLTGEVTDGLTAGTMDFAGIREIVIRLILMGAAIAIGRFCWRICLFGSARCVERDLRNKMFAHLETLSMRYFNTHKTGDLMAYFTNDLQAIREMAGNTVITTFDATVMLVLVLYSMIKYVNVRLTLVAVAPMVVIMIGDVFFGKAMHKRFLARQEAFGDLSDFSQEAISGIRVIKGFVQERHELAAFAKVNRDVRDKNMAVVRLVAIVMPMLDFIIGLSTLATLMYGGWLAIAGEITVGQFVAFNTYVTMLVWPMIAAGECISRISRGMASAKRIQEIFDAEPEITDENADPAITELHGNIEINNLTFSYPDGGERNALEDVSFRVHSGETMAVIGRTGSGKTTLVSLIERLWDAKDENMVRLDGHNISRIPLSVLRRDIAYVPQDSFLFSDTVRRNILFGLESEEEESAERRMTDAAMAADIHDNIMLFPKKYDTLVGERGVTVSGGQKQRIAIARALIKDAPILILDDALSAVDTDTEERILENLKKIREGKTTIMIAHRVSTIQNADHILVLDEGRRAEYGTHDELMRLGGLYRSTWEKQQLEKELRAEGGEPHE